MSRALKETLDRLEGERKKREKQGERWQIT